MGGRGGEGGELLAICVGEPQLTDVFCLACRSKQDIYWIGFVSYFGLYRRQTSQQCTILVPGFVAPKPSRTRTSRPIFLVPLFGSPCPICYNGFLFIKAILLYVKIYFLNRLVYKKMTFDQMRIGKCYRISFNCCNTVLCRLLNSVNLLCLYVCIYTNKYYYYIVEEYYVK